MNMTMEGWGSNCDDCEDDKEYVVCIDINVNILVFI